MSRIEEIIAEGNQYPLRPKRDNWIVCADGFKLSVIAGPGAYCKPRPALSNRRHPEYEDVPYDYPGPYTHVEVGYPSERPEPWHCAAWNDGYDRHEDHPVCDGWETYGSEADGIYAAVPVEMVRALVAAHGGEVPR